MMRVISMCVFFACAVLSSVIVNAVEEIDVEDDFVSGDETFQAQCAVCHGEGDDSSVERAVEKQSGEADLAILGFRYASLENEPRKCLLGHPELSEVLFVSANEQISIF